MIRCDHCDGQSANGIPYHKKGCPTSFGGWSDAQRRGIDIIVARVTAEFERKLAAEFTEWEYET